MAKDIEDFEKMSDDEFMDLLENIDSVDEGVDTEVDENSNENIEDDDFEDTDYPDGEADETENESEEESEETEETSTEPNDETEETEKSEDKENTQDQNDKVDDTETENTESKDETKPNNEIENYKKAYNQLLNEKAKYEDFYKQVTSEFVANGKVMKGFDDPKKIIRAQQMAAGFSEKMKAFKKYKPFINPLVENGLVDNPEKFNLAINAIAGDKEAIKQLIKESEIDPVELDMDNINYEPKNQIASDIEVAFDDVIETAEQYGVRDRVENVIGKDWDDNSVIELLEDPQNSADLINHISTGVYDMVQQRIEEKKMTDPYGAFSKKRSIDQYREAANELEQEYIQYMNAQQIQAQNEQQNNYTDPYAGLNESQQFSEEEIQAEIERIKLEKQQEQYSENIKRNEEVDKARRKAASVSKKKPRSKTRKESFDPGKLSDEEFEELLNSFITQ